MSSTCRFSSCKWTGPVDEIFTHCETNHSRYIREHKNQKYYDFVLDDLTKEAFLLTGPNGLYWFCADPQNHEDMLRWGVFHISDSEPIEYTLKCGLIRDGHAHYLGPFNSHSECSAEAYELEITFGELTFMNAEMPSRKVRIYIGEYDDSDDCYNPNSDELAWSPEDVALNKLCVEKFTCFICFEFIRRDARFCENKHFVCLNCFDEMIKRGCRRCPMCRTDYPYDCHNDHLERFLRMVKFPERNEEPTAADEPCTSNSKKLRLQ